MNIAPMCIYLAVRKVIPATWLNDRDQFIYPNDGWQTDYEFQADCLVYTLFHGQNRISSEGGANHWIPFTEEEVDAKERFKSHFMIDYMERGHFCPRTAPTQPDLFAGAIPTTAVYGEDKSVLAPKQCAVSTLCNTETTTGVSLLPYFSQEAKAVMDAGRELWRYYHSQKNANPDASFYDIRLHFQGTKTTKSGKTQMNPDSPDAHYTQLIHELRQRLKALAKRIEPKVYEYGFLKK